MLPTSMSVALGDVAQMEVYWMTRDLKSAEISSGQRVAAGGCRFESRRRLCLQASHVLAVSETQGALTSCVPVGMDVDGRN